MRRFVPLIIVVVGLLAIFIDGSDLLGLKLVNPTSGAPIKTQLGLDLQGGFEVDYQVLPSGGKTATSSDLQTIVQIITNRVNGIGTTEPIVETKGSDQIIVQVPGATDPNQIQQLVGATGLLTFVPLPADVYGTQTGAGSKPVPQSGEAIDPKLPALFGGDQVQSANPAIDSTTGQRAVSFQLKSQAAQAFSTWTSANVNHFFAIVLDGKVVSAPYIREPITNGSGQISGSFTAAEMNTLVNTLRYGALPFPLEQISNQDVSATLGADFLRRSLIAGLLGILLVFFFMLVYYRLPGAVACFALIYYALVVYAIFRLIPVTLTLAGVAGFVLSVGMAVDANILIFERTREELRAGKQLAAAVEAGFNRAWNSIFDSNVSSLITASILFYFGSSVIRGFALVLIIGVLTSMFTAITVSRSILRVVVRQQWARKANLYGVREEDFVITPTRGAMRREVRARG